MDSSSITFETWCKNHPDDHDAKWYRELYPWEVFQRIEYASSSIGVKQEIIVNNLEYIATVEKQYIAENGRINYLVHLFSRPKSKRQRWMQRTWNELFHLVAVFSGNFITLYTEKKDPSKVLLKKFLNLRLEDIEKDRSLPISGLIFRSLISVVAYDTYQGLQRFKSFPVIGSKNRDNKKSLYSLAPGTFEPFLSENRNLWISYSFTEEKAHRLALRLCGQARKIIVVFCHPTFTRHHRCSDPSTKIVSLSEFLRTMSMEIHRNYLQYARFLINHLQQTDTKITESSSSTMLLEAIRMQQSPIQVHTSDLREAKAGLGMIASTTGDIAYVCACANILNAAMNRKLKLYSGSVRLSKAVYSFKVILCRAIEDIICNQPSDVEVYCEPDGLVYISILGLQFSYHAIPRTPIIAAYEKSKKNVPQTWSGLRLQTVAPLVMRWARVLFQEESTSIQQSSNR